MVLIIIIGAACNCCYQLSLTRKDSGIKDLLFVKTIWLNTYFLANIATRNAALILCSLMMDLCVLSFLHRFVVHGSSCRLILASCFFYGFRALIQEIWYVPYPVGYNWGYPGIPSLFVSYGLTADFFYSGHVGICVLMYLEASKEGWENGKLFALLTMIMQWILMVVLRSHYTVDMVCGVIFAHYFYMISENYCYLVDQHIFGSTIEKNKRKKLTIKVPILSKRCVAP